MNDSAPSSTRGGTVEPGPDLNAGVLQGRRRRVLRAVVLGLLRLVVGLRIAGVERTPLSGPLLVVSNHLHNADPVLTCAAFPREIHYMAKREIFRIPVIHWILRKNGSFPVDRGKADRAALRRAEAALRQGIPVGMYPEGTRSVTRALQPAHAGAGLLALTTGAPVLPVVVTGTERLPFNGKRGKQQSAAGRPMPNPGHKGVRILFGEPFLIPRQVDGRRVSSAEATEIMMIEIARLLPPDYRGVYAEALANETVRRALPVTTGTATA